MFIVILGFVIVCWNGYKLIIIILIKFICCFDNLFKCCGLFWSVKMLLWIVGCNVLIWLFIIFGKCVKFEIEWIGIFVLFNICLVLLVEYNL